MIDVNQLRKGVTFVTDNDLWPSRFFKNRKDAENYIGIYKENNVPTKLFKILKHCFFDVDMNCFPKG